MEEPRNIIKVDTNRGHLWKIPCPRCKVASLYHPEGKLHIIHCVGCSFTDHTTPRRERREH